MARFHYSTALTALPQRWVEDLVILGFDLAEDTRIEEDAVLLPDGRRLPGVQLAKGRHLRPGATYEAASVEEPGQTVVTIKEWDRRGAVRVRQLMTVEDLTVEAEINLMSVERPRTVRAGLDLRWLGRRSSLTRLSGRAGLDLDSWWQHAAGSPASGSPVEARLRHLLASARITATPAPRNDGQWDLRVSLTLQGRSVLRPLAAVALRLARRPIHHAFTDALDDVAEYWNGTLSAALRKDRAQLRKEILAAALDDGGPARAAEA